MYDKSNNRKASSVPTTTLSISEKTPHMHTLAYHQRKEKDKRKSKILNSLGKCINFFLGCRIRVLRSGICPALDVVAVRLDGLHGLAPNVAVLLDELGEEAAGREVASHVDLHEDLTGAAVAGADADGGDAQLLRDEGCNLGGDSLEDDGVAASLLHGEGILENAHGTGTRLSLDTETTEGVLALRGKADVTEDGDACRGDPVDRGGHLLAALELHALNTTLLDKADGSGKGLFRGDLVCTHGKITDLGWISTRLGKGQKNGNLTVKADLVARATERQ